MGNKEERPELQMKMKTKNYNILLTTYEVMVCFQVYTTLHCSKIFTMVKARDLVLGVLFLGLWICIVWY